MGNLGNAYRNLGDYAKAIEYAQQWLAIAREINAVKARGGWEIWRNLLTFPSATTPKSSSTLSSSWRSRKIKHRQSEGAALGNLGIAYFSLGDYAKAIEYVQQSLAIAREIKDRETEGKALGSLGNAYLSLDDYAKAIDYA